VGRLERLLVIGRPEIGYEREQVYPGETSPPPPDALPPDLVGKKAAAIEKFVKTRVLKEINFRSIHQNFVMLKSRTRFGIDEGTECSLG